MVVNGQLVHTVQCCCGWKYFLFKKFASACYVLIILQLQRKVNLPVNLHGNPFQYVWKLFRCVWRSITENIPHWCLVWIEPETQTNRVMCHCNWGGVPYRVCGLSVPVCMIHLGLCNLACYVVCVHGCVCSSWIHTCLLSRRPIQMSVGIPGMRLLTRSYTNTFSPQLKSSNTHVHQTQMKMNPWPAAILSSLITKARALFPLCTSDITGNSTFQLCHKK